MGTHMTVLLRDTSEENIKACNEQVRAMGYKSEVFNNVPYGPFVTQEQLEEDCRYMNEDPEGLKQDILHPRPITPEYLTQYFWLKKAQFYCKLSGSYNAELEQALIVAKWAENHPAKINKAESDNYTPDKVIPYIS